MLDYTYVYELDGAKLFCQAPDPNSPSGKCDGVIDYDDGFNFLQCTKCGVKYKAKELAKHVENKIVTVKKEGETKMKIRTTGGTGGTNNVQVNKSEDVATRGSIKKIPSNSVSKKPVIEVPDSTTVKTEEVKPVVEEVKSAVSFGEKQTNENDDKRSYVYEIEKALESIKESFSKIKIQQVKDDVTSTIINTISEMIDDPDIIIVEGLSNKSEKSKAILGTELIIDSFEKMSIDDINEVLATNDMKTFIESNVDIVGSIDQADDGRYVLSIDMVNTNNNETIFNSISKNLDIVEESDDEPENAVVEEVPEKKEEKKSVNNDSSPIYYQSEIIDIKNVIPSEPHMNVVLINDNEGGYLADKDGCLIVVDRIDDKDVNEVTVTSKYWLDNVIKELEELKGEHITVDENQETEPKE